MQARKNRRKQHQKHFYLLSTIAVVWVFVLTMVVPVEAADFSGTFSNFTLTAKSSGEVTITPTSTGWAIKAYGTTKAECGGGTTNNAVTVTFTLTNTATKNDGSVRGVSFKITTTGMATNDSSVGRTLDGTTTSVTYTMTSGGSSSEYAEASISFSDIVLESLGNSIKTVFSNRDGGTFYVGDTLIAKETTLTNNDDYTYELKAEADDGYTFLGWLSTNGPLGTSEDTTFSYKGSEENTIWPLFIKTGSAVYYIAGASPTIYYGYIDEAIGAAGNSGTIVLSQSGVMYTSSGETSASLSGQTLILPYSAGELAIGESTNTDGINSTWIHANLAWTSAKYATVTGVLDPYSGVHLTMTIPDGATLNVNSGSKLVIGGTIVGGTNTTYAVTGATAGAHSNLVVNGTLNVSGILSCTGYILGEGQVNVPTGGAVYLPFVIMDHRDGNYAYDCKPNNTFPSNRYTMLNLQADATISYGGRIYGYVDIFTQSNMLFPNRHNVQTLNIVGPVTTTTADMSLIMLSSGGSMDITYDESKVLNVSNATENSKGFYNKVGKTTIAIQKGATMGQTTMTITVATITESFTTAGRDFALPYNFDIILQDGEYSIPQTLVMCPGSTLTVESTASLTIPSGGKLVVLDGLYDHSHRSGSVSLHQVVELYYPYSTDLEKYGFSKTANFIVDGSLTVASGGAFGGYVQTGGTGIIEMAGTPSAFAGVGNVADDDDQDKTYASQIGNHAGRTERTLGAWLYDTSGNRITMSTGNTYCAADAGKHTIATYDYTLYTKEDGTSQSVTGETLNAEIKGSWGVHSYDAEVTAPTCVNGGYTTHTCAVCGDSYQDTPTDATGIHTYNNGVQTTAPTCTTPGILTYTCGVCSDSYNEDIIAAKIGDTEYTILSDAITAAGPSDTIDLQANISGEVPIGKLLTINKNDCTVELKAADGFVITETDEANIVTSLIKIMATNIKAGDGLDLYFYILKSAWNSAFPNTQGQAVITRNYVDDRGTVTLESVEWRTDVEGYYRFCYSDIAAKEMTDPVSIVIKVGDTVVSNTYTETIREYALRTFDPDTSELNTALMDMLNYGAAAQEYFGYNTGNLANAKDDGGKVEQYAECATPDGTVKPENHLVKGENIVAVSVSAKNKLMLTFYFENITKDMTAYITYTNHGGTEVTQTVSGSDFIEYNGWLGVDVIGLAIADGRQVVSCEVKNGEEVVASASDSVEGYIFRNYQEGKVVVLDMLMRFVDSAYEYFH